MKIRCPHCNCAYNATPSKGGTKVRQTGIWNKDMRGMNMSQDLWQHIIGTGSVSIGTAATAGAEIQLYGLNHPQEIVNLIHSLRKNSLPKD